MSRTEGNTAALFWAKLESRVQVSGSGCWLWTGTTSEKGYGRLKVAGRKQQAHRVVYEFLVGPIPEGLVLDHLCRVRNCVHPLHLEPVTSRTNILRGIGVAALNARRTRCPAGHPFAGDNLYVEVDSDGRRHRRCRECTRVRTGDISRRKRAARRAAA